MRLSFYWVTKLVRYKLGAAGSPLGPHRESPSESRDYTEERNGVSDLDNM